MTPILRVDMADCGEAGPRTKRRLGRILHRFIVPAAPCANLPMFRFVGGGGRSTCDSVALPRKSQLRRKWIYERSRRRRWAARAAVRRRSEDGAEESQRGGSEGGRKAALGGRSG